MTDFSHDFAQHRYWEMKEGSDPEPAWAPPQPRWEAVLLCYSDEKGLPIERPVWTRPITNGKLPIGAWVFDVKVRGFIEKGMSFVGQLVRSSSDAGVQALAQLVPALAPLRPLVPLACLFCGEMASSSVPVTTTILHYSGGNEKMLASLPVGGTTGCLGCREARRLPEHGFMLSVKPNEKGLIDTMSIKAALWKELQRFEGP